MVYPRLWTRRLRWRLFLFALFCLVSAASARAAEPAYRVTLIRHVVTTEGPILLTYSVESASYPVIQATGGDAYATTVPDGAGGWRATINATLDPCRGSLAVATVAQPDWQILIQQHCRYFPIGVKQ